MILRHLGGVAHFRYLHLRVSKLSPSNSLPPLHRSFLLVLITFSISCSYFHYFSCAWTVSESELEAIVKAGQTLMLPPEVRAVLHTNARIHQICLRFRQKYSNLNVQTFLLFILCNFSSFLSRIYLKKMTLYFHFVLFSANLICSLLSIIVFLRLCIK